MRPENVQKIPAPTLITKIKISGPKTKPCGTPNFYVTINNEG